MKNLQIKSGHLFICYTPLHVLIAKEIIGLEKPDAYTLIYYYSNDTEKIRYYYNQVAAGASKAFYIKKDNNLLHTMKVLLSLFFDIRKFVSRSPVVYAGNVKTLYSRFIVFSLKAWKLHTFDDGIGNVRGEGYFYNDLAPTVYSRFLSLFGLDFSYSSMYRRIQKHYTIYKIPNVMPFCEYIDLFNFGSQQQAVDAGPGVSVLLTSTLYEEGVISLDLEKRLYRKIIEEFKVNYIIAHPLEVYNKCENPEVITIKTEKIAEDIIMDLRQKFGNVKVIGWYSSTLIHVSGIAGIETINVHFKGIPDMESARHFFESLNVKTYIPDLG